ncbi:MAG: hypothetical protein SV186_06290 [Candidatus Nanohaloarchaea archaeon]|nr:hypothetical protein [Candidatus Nanohaloarchaea archaeon]
MRRLVIGIGQAGIDVIDNISRDISNSVDTAAIDLDKYALHSSGAQHTILVRDTGVDVGKSRGLRIDQEVDLNTMEEIESVLEPYDVVYLVGALGGRAGGVILPAVAKKAKEMGKIVRGKIILPFQEEKSKREIAEVYLEEVKPLFTDVDVYDNHEYMKQSEGEIGIDSLYSLHSIFEEINRDISREIQRDIAYEG